MKKSSIINVLLAMRYFSLRYERTRLTPGCWVYVGRSTRGSNNAVEKYHSLIELTSSGVHHAQVQSAVQLLRAAAEATIIGRQCRHPADRVAGRSRQNTVLSGGQTAAQQARQDGSSDGTRRGQGHGDSVLHGVQMQNQWALMASKGFMAQAVYCAQMSY